MPDPLPDFWPANISEVALVTPLSILKQEASYLGPKTNQLVKAEVRTSAGSDGRFSHSFNIVAPSLNNYLFQLFIVNHLITLYPASLIWNGVSYTIPNQEALIQKLQEIIVSGQTKQIVEALLAQVTSPPQAGGS